MKWWSATSSTASSCKIDPGTAHFELLSYGSSYSQSTTLLVRNLLVITKGLKNIYEPE